MATLFAGLALQRIVDTMREPLELQQPVPVGAVLVDFDGTLTEPGSLDFAAVREAIQCPPGEPMLEFIASMPELERRRDAERVLEEFEADAAARTLCVRCEHMLVVGDFRFDIEAGHAAGARSVLLRPAGLPPPGLETPPDYVIARLAQLDRIVRG